MTDLNTLPTADLLNLYNTVFGKNVKKGSYTRGRMIQELEETGHPYDLPGEEASADEPQTGHCPLCNGDPSYQTAAGEEGTFLGDSCNFCHKCGKAYNILTGEEVEIATPGSGKKRRILNPQPKIDAKTDACAEQGIEVFYVRADRMWAFTDNVTGKLLLSMTSRQFAGYSPKELVDYAVGFRKSK